MVLNAVLSIAGFITGFAAGALWKGRNEADWVKAFVVVVVTSVWASSFLVDVYSVDYDPPTGMYPLMTAIVGLFAADRLRAK